MQYTVVFIQKENVSGTETCSGRISEAQDAAYNAVSSGTADRAEVRDESGNIVFRYPAPKGRAPSRRRAPPGKRR